MPSHVSSTTPTAPSAQVSTPCHSVQSPRANPDLSRNLGAQHTRVSGASSGSLCNNCNCLAERRGIIVTSWCVSHRLMCVCVLAADAAGADAPDAGQLAGLCRQIPWRLLHPQPGCGAAAKHWPVAPLAFPDAWEASGKQHPAGSRRAWGDSFLSVALDNEAPAQYGWMDRGMAPAPASINRQALHP